MIDPERRKRFLASPWGAFRLVLAVIFALTAAIVGCGGGGGSSNSPPPANNPVPTITGLSPSSAMAGAASQALTINGTGFLSSSTVTYNGIAHAATFVSSAQLTVSLTASDQATAGTYPVVVKNPTPGGGASNAVSFAVDDPTPAISSLSPSSLPAGSTPQTLVINGSGFVQASTATYNGTARAVSFTNSSMIEIQLTASDLATAGSYPVIVTNPSPGGGTSNAVNLTVGSGTALLINVTGLPSGTSANVTVTGPNGYSEGLTQTTTLNGLNAGTYTVVAAILPPSTPGNAVFVPLITGSPANVTQGSSTTVNVAYGSLSTTWTPIGPKAIAGVIQGGPAAAGKMATFAVDNANPQEMFAGGGPENGVGPYSEAGIYKSSDGGQTWQQADSGLTDTAIGALWMDQSKPSTLLAGTYSTGIYQSTNGGGNWTLTGSFGSTTSFLQSGGTLYAGTATGIGASTDDGATWSIIEPTSVPVRSLAGAGGAVYAGLDDGHVLVQSSPSAPWVTTTPTTLPYTFASSLAVNPANPADAFVVDRSNYTPSLYSTTTAGSIWTLVNAPTGCYSQAVQVIAIDPLSGALDVGCDGTLWQSTDMGGTWTQFPNTNWDMRMVIPDAGGVAGTLVIGSDQGLYETKNGGTTWQDFNGNMTSSILFSVAVSGSTIITGAQDFSPIYSFDGGGTWGELGGAPSSAGEAAGEGGPLRINPANPNYVYAYTGAGLQVSTDGGHTYQLISGFSVVPGACPDCADLVAVDASSPSIVYAVSENGVYKSTDWGVSWALQSWPISHPSLVSVDPTNGENIFVGQQAGGLMVSHDGGQTWSASDLGSASSSPVTLAVNPLNPQIVLLGMSTGPDQNGGVLRSTDGGANFSPVNNGISSQTLHTLWTGSTYAIRYDPSGSGIAGVGTQTGLYLTSDNGGYWVDIRANAVPYIFSDLTWSGGYLYVSTLGEGVLRMTFPF